MRCLSVAQFVDGWAALQSPHYVDTVRVNRTRTPASHACKNAGEQTSPRRVWGRALGVRAAELRELRCDINVENV